MGNRIDGWNSRHVNHVEMRSGDSTRPRQEGAGDNSAGDLSSRRSCLRLQSQSHISRQADEASPQSHTASQRSSIETRECQDGRGMADEPQ